MKNSRYILQMGRTFFYLVPHKNHFKILLVNMNEKRKKKYASSFIIIYTFMLKTPLTLFVFIFHRCFVLLVCLLSLRKMLVIGLGVSFVLYFRAVDVILPLFFLIVSFCECDCANIILKINDLNEDHYLY